MHRPLVQLVLSRVREFYREPAAIFWVYGFPLILAVALGYAFRNRPVENIRLDVAVAQESERTAAEQLAARWTERDPRLKIEVHDEPTSLNRLRSDKTDLVLLPDPTSPAKWKYQLDENRPGSVLARAAADNVVLREANQQAVIPTAEQMPDDSGGRYIDFLLPGLIGINLMGGGLFGVGFVIVDMRVRKLLKRFLATPMRKTDFMLGIIISRLIFTIAEIAVLLTVARFYFEMRVHGSWPALVILIFLGGACFAGMGLLIGCRAKTLETASGLLNAVMLPMYVVSGVFFKASYFPDAAQPVIQNLPLTALNDGLRAVINDGAGMEAVVRPAVVLTAWGAVSFFLALKLFRWR